MKKKMYIFILGCLTFIFSTNVVTASPEIRKCLYEFPFLDENGTQQVNKAEIVIDSTYNGTLTYYEYNILTHKMGAGKKESIYNWDEDLKQGIKEKSSCPTYLVNAPKEYKHPRFYAYFNEEKAKKRKESNGLLPGEWSKIVSDQNLGNQSGDKNESVGDTGNNNNSIKEFKKTYQLLSLTNKNYGDELVFTVQYNMSEKTLISSSLQLVGSSIDTAFIYNGDQSSYQKNVILPIVEKESWPQNFYCSELTSTIHLTGSYKYIMGDKNDVICSFDRSNFSGNIAPLAHFTTKTDNKQEELPTKEACKANPNLEGCARNRCEVIRTDGEVFKILKEIIGYIQIGSVFAVLIFCVLDLGGAVASSDDEAFRKARNKVFKRIIALVLIFLVPLLVNFVINLVNLGACSEEDYDFIGNLFN